MIKVTKYVFFYDRTAISNFLLAKVKNDIVYERRDCLTNFNVISLTFIIARIHEYSRVYMFAEDAKFIFNYEREHWNKFLLKLSTNKMLR